MKRQHMDDIHVSVSAAQHATHGYQRPSCRNAIPSPAAATAVADDKHGASALDDHVT